MGRPSIFQQYNNPSTLRLVSLCNELGLGETAYGKLLNAISAPEFNVAEVAPTHFLAKKVESTTIPHIVCFICICFMYGMN